MTRRAIILFWLAAAAAGWAIVNAGVYAITLVLT
jgi:hypothetical protein